MTRGAVLMALVALSACTTVGVHVPGARGRMDFGPPVELRVCVLRDESVSTTRADALIAAVQAELESYGIRVRAARVDAWSRPGFFVGAIMDSLRARPLPATCDRMLGLVGRNVADTLWSLALPQVLGAVDSTTATRGYVVAEVASIDQLIFSSPRTTAVHEVYHMLGCRHALTKTACYRQIQELKRAYAPGANFFPGVTGSGRPILTRREAEARLSAPSP